jgi:diguanylate cyclase (GGDEF)-like protein
MKVLIVDDSPEAIVIARARLSKERLEIISAEGGRAGLDVARREKPDLILLDLNMPDLSGFEVCQTHKGDTELCMIPVIFLSGSGGPDEKVKGLDLGAVDYVTKPFDAFELRARVRAALRTKRLQDLLIEYAHIDPLTGLPNRRALTERLGEEWERIRRHGGSLALIMTDIDTFKRVNDTFGHNVGDRVLQELAKTIAGHCRAMDVPARYGGDEFVVLVPGETQAGAAILAERVRESVQQQCLEAGIEKVQITASFGVADSCGAAETREIIERADKALYAAKDAGRNAVRCTEALLRPIEPF